MLLNDEEESQKCVVYVNFPIEEFSTIFFKVNISSFIEDKAIEGENMPKVTVEGMISNAHTKLEIIEIDWATCVLTLRKTDIAGGILNEPNASQEFRFSLAMYKTR